MYKSYQIMYASVVTFSFLLLCFLSCKTTTEQVPFIPQQGGSGLNVVPPPYGRGGGGGSSNAVDTVPTAPLDENDETVSVATSEESFFCIKFPQHPACPKPKDPNTNNWPW